MVINERFQTLENIFVVAILAILNNHRLAGYFEGEVDRTVFSDLFITIEDHLVTLRIEVFPRGKQGEVAIFDSCNEKATLRTDPTKRWPFHYFLLRTCVDADILMSFRPRILPCNTS